MTVQLGYGYTLLLRLLAILLLLQSTAYAQSYDFSKFDPEKVQFSILRSGRGIPLYAFGGHILLRLESTSPKVDMTINWGVFDYHDPNFLWNYLRGYLNYRVATNSAAADIRGIRSENRGLVQARLNLTTKQKQKLLERIGWWLKEENRRFRYDIWGANCSLLPMRELAFVLGKNFRSQYEKAYPQTFRQLGRHYLNHLPDVAWAIDLFVAERIDETLDAWDLFVMPMKVILLLEESRAFDDQGQATSHPLVTDIRQILPEGNIPSASYSWHGAVWILMLLGVALSFYASRVYMLTLASWGFVSGLCAVAMLALWFLTEHQHCRWNANLFFFWPTDFVFLYGAFRKNFRIVNKYLSFHVIIALIGVLLNFISGDQDVSRVFWLAFPIWVGLSMLSYKYNRLSRKTTLA